MSFLSVGENATLNHEVTRDTPIEDNTLTQQVMLTSVIKENIIKSPYNSEPGHEQLQTVGTSLQSLFNMDFSSVNPHSNYSDSERCPVLWGNLKNYIPV